VMASENISNRMLPILEHRGKAISVSPVLTTHKAWWPQICGGFQPHTKQAITSAVDTNRMSSDSPQLSSDIASLETVKFHRLRAQPHKTAPLLMPPTSPRRFTCASDWPAVCCNKILVARYFTKKRGLFSARLWRIKGMRSAFS
jgi:hypothetical protein